MRFYSHFKSKVEDESDQKGIFLIGRPWFACYEGECSWFLFNFSFQCCILLYKWLISHNISIGVVTLCYTMVSKRDWRDITGTLISLKINGKNFLFFQSFYFTLRKEKCLNNQGLLAKNRPVDQVTRKCLSRPQ